MHHGVDAVVAQRVGYLFAVVDPKPKERDAVRNRFGMTGRQVVQHNDRVAIVEQRPYRMAPNVPCAAGHEYATHRQRPIEW
jgi:hypothetical protein